MLFSRHGIPDTLVTDNGPQFTSYVFKSFTNTYQIEHCTYSPHYPQSNGRAEKVVQIVKNLIKKVAHHGSDPHLALLDFRNIPGLSSPTQLLTRRRSIS